MGAQGLADEGKLRSTWRASSPVRAMRIGIGTMRVFLRHGGQQERWRTLWDKTEFLRFTRLFGERISMADQERIADAMKTEKIAVGAHFVPSRKALCFVRDGELDVSYSPNHRETIVGGGFMNEEAVLGTATSDWMARATRETAIAWIPAEVLARIPVIMWKLLEAHDRRRCAVALQAGG